MASSLAAHAEMLAQVRTRLAAGNHTMQTFGDEVLQAIDSIGNSFNAINIQFDAYNREIGTQATLIQNQQTEIQRLSQASMHTNHDAHNMEHTTEPSCTQHA